MFRDLYVPIFEKYNVSLVLSGHSHHYQRTHPMIQNKKADIGPVYIVCGTGGYSLSKGYTSNPEWIAFRQSDQFAYCTMEIENETDMLVEHIKPNSNEIIDQAIIKNPNFSKKNIVRK